MRLLALVAFATLATAGLSASPAAARPGHDHGHGQGWHHGRPGHGWHGGHRRRCTWVWHHHHRVRRCW